MNFADDCVARAFEYYRFMVREVGHVEAHVGRAIQSAVREALAKAVEAVDETDGDPGEAILALGGERNNKVIKGPVKAEEARCGAPPTVYTFAWVNPRATHGCTRRLGHKGKHRNAVVEWSDVQEPRARGR